MRRGLNYKLAILLHGKPGTGKSSLIQVIASKFNRNLNCVNSLIGLRPEISRFRNGILAIEEVDTLGSLNWELFSIADDPEEFGQPELALDADSPKMVLYDFLNTLDRLATPNFLITIITTNHIDALDLSIVRSCRIDLQLEVSALDYSVYVGMFSSYYDGALPA